MISITQIIHQPKTKQNLNKITQLNKIKLIQINHLILTKQIKTNHLIIIKLRLLVQTKQTIAVRKTKMVMTLSLIRGIILLILLISSNLELCLEVFSFMQYLAVQETHRLLEIVIPNVDSSATNVALMF
jgi:hypothetical protein